MSHLLPILHLDDELVVVNKPSGMVVHASKLTGRETETCVTLLRRELGQPVHPIHRLDRATSGVLVFGRTSEAAARVQAEFQARLARKRYVAVVRGYVDESGEITKPLVKDPKNGPKTGAARLEAITRYRRLGQVDLPNVVSPGHPSSRYSLVEVETLTGRMHQIRRHFYGLSHPLVGDTVYGDGRHNRFFRERYDTHRLCLAAIEVALPGREPFRAPPAPELLALFDRLGWSGVAFF